MLLKTLMGDKSKGFNSFKEYKHPVLYSFVLRNPYFIYFFLIVRTGLLRELLFYDGLKNINGPSVWLQRVTRGRGRCPARFGPHRSSASSSSSSRW
jgi:hypothetical protein